MFEIHPSVASANQLCIEEEIRRLGDHPFIHLDVEDGNFVPNITFGLKMIRQIHEAFPKKTLDAHLMVTDPLSYIAPMAACGVSALCTQIEAAPYPSLFINTVKSHGMSVGFALNPRTPVTALTGYLPSIDFVLVMTCEPDGQGQAFLPFCLAKITELKALAPSLSVWVDGSITQHNVTQVLQAGADALVLGRAIFTASDPAQTIRDWYSRF